MKGKTGLLAANPEHFYLVPDPSDDVVLVRLVESAVAADPRRLLVRITPEPARQSKNSMRSVNADIARALDRDSDTAYVGRSDAEAWINLAAWMVADEIQDVFVVRAHLLGGYHCERFVDLAALSGARLWLLAQSDPLPKPMRRAMRFWPIETMPVEEFVRRWSLGLGDHEVDCSGSRRTDADRESALFPEVPSDEFFTFRDSARQLLGPDDFARFDVIFQQARMATTQWLQTRTAAPGEAEVAEFLRSLIRPSGDRNIALTRLRAAQTVLFEEWIFVKANFDRLIGGLFATPPCELTSDAAARLRRLHHVRDAALATLALSTPLRPAEIQALSLDCLSVDGSEIVSDSARFLIPPLGARFLRAHRLVRVFQGARDGDQLFGFTRGRDQVGLNARGIHAALLSASRQTGLFITAHWTRRGDETAPQWLQRWGVCVQLLNRPKSGT